MRALIITLVSMVSVFGALPCAAQVTDTAKATVATAGVPVKTDTTKPSLKLVDKDSLAFAMRPHPFQPNPKKAGLYAGIIPGMGQIYNRQYWKLPIVYAGLGAGGYFVISNLNNYRKYRKAYIGRLTNSNYHDEFSQLNVGDQTSYVQQLQNDYDKNLNLSVLLTGVGYFLQVLDAITSAHLKNFDISRDISMHMQPVATPVGLGMGLVMNF